MKINLNIRCIEIYLATVLLVLEIKINLNMRCIEIKWFLEADFLFEGLTST